MSSLFILILFSLFSASVSFYSDSFHLNCGGSYEVTSDGQIWSTDKDYISTGTNKKVNLSWVLPILTTVRSFPKDGNLNKKFCYEMPVNRSKKYMVRTTYYYGDVNGPSHKTPPVFDQIVDGTLWSMVNTTEDYARNMSSYYEGVFQPVGKNMSVCVGVNKLTDSDPFISAVELVMLEDTVYNSTDFKKFGLRLVARNNFGYQGPMIRSPDDQFDRIWQPFGDSNPLTGVSNVSVSGIWNLPPAKIFDTRLTVDSGPMDLQWPEGPLPSSTYYIALYFADDRASSSHREFSISINDVPYISNLNVTSSGVAVFATKWPLVGLTNLKFTPAVGSDSGPLINGGEIFDILLLGRKTLVRDVIALEKIKASIQYAPEDWNGDPCYPAEYSWTGITCSNGTKVRVTAINLPNMGLSGSLSPFIGNLTALNTLVLRQNSLSGTIPSTFGNLKLLEKLDLGNNQFNGVIPSSLGEIKSLRELHLENNYLSGTIPTSLIGKPGLNFTYTPGNRLSLPPGQ